MPDALIFNEDGWALAIESKISSGLTKDQLQRHYRTIQKCGFETVEGLTITVDKPSFKLDGWQMITWKDVYAWGNRHKGASQWAGHMVEYFNIAESRMANDEYLREGTITEFSGVYFEPYTYLEGKRILRLLSRKLRENTKFIDKMGLNAAIGRAAITDQASVWDFIPFKTPQGREMPFTHYPHCTIGINAKKAEAMITFPHALSPALRKRLHGDHFEDFTGRLRVSVDMLKRNLKSINYYRPTIRVMQRRYKTQRSIPHLDGMLEFDIRATFGDPTPHYGPSIKKQEEWARNAYELLKNKRSNIQLQIGAEFYDFNELNHKNADQHFTSVFEALKPFVDDVINL